MRKNRVRLTESQLHRVIKESVKRVLNESGIPRGIQAIAYHLEKCCDCVDANSCKFNEADGTWSCIADGVDVRVGKKGNLYYIYLDGDILSGPKPFELAQKAVWELEHGQNQKMRTWF